MNKIGKTPKKAIRFFKQIHKHFGQRSLQCFSAWIIVTTINRGITIERPTQAPGKSTCVFSN
jgi:hypothetical protein